jgi:hypothetical protein
MSEALLFAIGFFFVLVVGAAILMIAYQDAEDRKAQGKTVESPIDRVLIDKLGTD